MVYYYAMKHRVSLDIQTKRSAKFRVKSQSKKTRNHENYNAGKNEEEKEDTLSLHPHSRMQGRQRSVIDLSSQTKQLCQKDDDSDDIKIKYPLGMDIQSPQEFKEECDKIVEGHRKNFNGFMVDELDKNLTQVICSSKKNTNQMINRDLFLNDKRELDDNIREKLIGILKDNNVETDLEFGQVVRKHYLDKINDCVKRSKLKNKKLENQKKNKQGFQLLRLGEDMQSKLLTKQNEKPAEVKPKESKLTKAFKEMDYRTLRDDPNVRKLIESSKRLMLPALSKRMNKIKNYK